MSGVTPHAIARDSASLAIIANFWYWLKRQPEIAMQHANTSAVTAIEGRELVDEAPRPQEE
ncbi:MAG: hypothetical protein GY733_17765 [bacterium]|nr:hypothetical protein [bacterium]